MRNKGFFWFLTIVLTAVCIYQLSFTLVASNVEEDAAKEAVVRAEELKKKTFEMDSTMAFLPNNSRVDFSKPESFEIAKAAFLNEVLAERAEEEVYPIIGSNFQSVKKRSLAFGLDLVGGMSVTVEISVPEFVKSFARNNQDLVFKKPYDKAYSIHTNKGGDFISLFIGEFEKAYPKRLLVRELDITEVKELVQHEKTGLIVDQPDAVLLSESIKRYFEEDLKQAFAQNLEVEKAKHSWANFASKLIDFTKEISRK